MEIINVINLGPAQPALSLNCNIRSDQIKRYREERALSICEQSKHYGFAVKFWEGVYEKKGFVGVNRAFKKIVRDAKERSLPYVIIGEDDMLFSADGAWGYYLQNKPEDYDMYLGGIYSGTVKEGRIIAGYSGHTLVTVHSRFYDVFLSVTDLDHLDRRLGALAHQYKYFVCSPYVVTQLQGFSDNHRRETRHKAYLDKMELFGG
jgi:hypothetical protein